MPHSRVSPYDGDGHTQVEALGELFIPSGLWGWDRCAGVDCVLCERLENIQPADHATECALYFVLLVRRSSNRILVEYGILSLVLTALIMCHTGHQQD